MHVLGTAGHVDHGKSTLVERLTGIDPDRFAEEKRRGLTIDLGFAWVPLASGREVGLIDVPGHERFIKNMLSGAGGVSVCLFVVAANEGWKPQSAEHLAIVDVLGVSHGVVALTKSDLVDADTLDLVTAEIEEKLEPSSLAGAPIVACSAVTGNGIDELLEELDRVVSTAPAAPDRGRPRLWVDRVFTIAGSGTVVTGTLMGGSLATGAEVEVAPEGRRARIRSIQSHKKEVPSVGPGNRVALNLAGLERQGAERGDAVVEPTAWRMTSRIDAVVRVSPVAITARPHELTEKGAHLLYAGSAETPVRMKLLGPQKIGSGERGYAQLYLRDPLPLTRGDRFVLRDAGRVLTLGGGVVLDPLPQAARRNDEERVRLLEQLDGATPEEALSALVTAEGELPIGEARLRSGAFASGSGFPAARRPAPEPGSDLAKPGGRPPRAAAAGWPAGVIALGDRLVSAERARVLESQALARLRRHHEGRPLERTMPREALRQELELEAASFDALLARTSDVVEEGAGVRLATHAVGLSDQQRQQRDRLIAAIEEAGYQPPLATDLDADAALLRSLVEAGELVRIESFYLTAAQASEARTRVREQIEREGPVTVAQIRDLLGTTRKYAVPLCEWLDSTGATIRRGDRRTLGPNP